MNSLIYGDDQQFEYLDGIPPIDDFKNWVSISDKSISIISAEKTTSNVRSQIPLFSSVIHSSVDNRTGNVFSIINGCTHYLRKVQKGFDIKGFQLINQNLPVGLISAYYHHKDIENQKQYQIFLSSLTRSYVLEIQEEQIDLKYTLKYFNKVYQNIKENEIIKGVSYQENNRILIVLSSRIIIIDNSNRNIISEISITNEAKQQLNVSSCSILDNQWIIVLTQTNQMLAYYQDFITIKQYNTPHIITDSNQNNFLTNKQISSIHLYSSNLQNNSTFLCIGYYNQTMGIYSWNLNKNSGQIVAQNLRLINTPSVVHDISYYNNSESQGILLSYRNGTIQDLIQIDYSKNIQEQSEQVKQFDFQENDICKIIKYNNTIYLQSDRSIFIYQQIGIDREVGILTLNNEKLFLQSPKINIICPISKDKSMIVCSQNLFVFKTINTNIQKVDYKQMVVPLKSNNEKLQEKFNFTITKNSARSLISCYYFKRIIFNQDLDVFILINQIGNIYIVNRNGYVLQEINDIPEKYNHLRVTNMKKVNLSEKDQYLFITTENHGALLIQIQFMINRVNRQNNGISQNVLNKQVSKLVVINQFILKNQKEEEILNASDVTVMGLLNFLFICGQNVIFCYLIQKEIDEISEDENIQFIKISQLILPSQKQLICLDSINNLILMGDLKDSVLVYNIQHKYENGKHFFYWNLEKTEFNQRALKDSLFIDKSNFLGIDKYGEVFGSVFDQKVYHDANYNLHNFSLMNIRETGQIVKYCPNHRKTKQLNDKVDEIANEQSLKQRQLCESNTFYICGIGGSIYQIIYCDLLFYFQFEKYNSYILIIENILRQIKSCKASQKKNSIDLQRKTRRFGDGQRFVDISLFESLSKQEFSQVFQDLQNQINKEEIKYLNFEELKQVFNYMISLFSN